MGKEFELELAQIKTRSVRTFVEKVLEVVPEYFWHVAASSTGKYHPQYCLGEGGLVRHTKAAVRIALELFRNDSVQRYTEIEKDFIVAALILHDTVKHGFTGSKYTVADHPMLVEKLVESVELTEEEKGVAEHVFPLIRSHMGQWNTAFNSNKELMPKPSNRIEIFVHMCDYLASRKSIEINFDAPVGG